MRGRGMRRCLLEGKERFDLFPATVVLANNLLVIAATCKSVWPADAPPDPVPAVFAITSKVGAVSKAAIGNLIILSTPPNSSIRPCTRSHGGLLCARKPAPRGDLREFETEASQNPPGASPRQVPYDRRTLTVSIWWTASSRRRPSLISNPQPSV
jgi:hypothetical protein